MEDSHISAPNVLDGVGVFGVFDGHGGKCTCYANSLGREVALYVKERYLDELKKLDSFKRRDFSAALRESFIRIDEMLKSPQGQKDVKKHSATEEA